MNRESTRPAGVSAARIQRDIEYLAGVGGTPSGGVSRTSFSAADQQVRQWLAATSAESGLSFRTDGIGNVFIGVPAPDTANDAAPVWTGSHLDSVLEGGRFDGVLGSVAGIEVARQHRLVPLGKYWRMSPLVFSF